MNAAAGLVVGGHANDIKQGVEQAAAAIDSGAAKARLDLLVKVSNA
jgi:anthranilate phosphoribosyltransferase